MKGYGKNRNYNSKTENTGLYETSVFTMLRPDKSPEQAEEISICSWCLSVRQRRINLCGKKIGRIL